MSKLYDCSELGSELALSCMMAVLPRNFPSCMLITLCSYSILLWIVVLSPVPWKSLIQVSNEDNSLDDVLNQQAETTEENIALMTAEQQKRQQTFNRGPKLKGQGKQQFHASQVSSNVRRSARNVSTDFWAMSYEERSEVCIFEVLLILA